MTLKNKLRKAGIGIGLAGILGVSGCGTVRTYERDVETQYNEDTAALSFGLMGMGVGKNNPAAVATGRALLDYSGRRQNSNDIEINIKNGQDTISGKAENDKNEKPIYFACNEIRDIDSNGINDYPYDFKGLKNSPNESFLTNQDVFIVAMNVYIPKLIVSIVDRNGRVVSGGKTDFDIRLVVTDENEKLVYKEELKAPYNNKLILSQHFKVGELKPGKYTTYWLSSEHRDKLNGEIKFCVSEP